MKAGPQVFQPRFTSHGFQYIEITGIDTPLPLADVQGVAISSVHDADGRLPDVERQGEPALVEPGLVQRRQLPHHADGLPAAERAHGLVGRHQRLLAHRDLRLERRPVPHAAHVRHARRPVRRPAGSPTSLPSAAASAACSGAVPASSCRGRSTCSTRTPALLERHYPAMVAYIELPGNDPRSEDGPEHRRHAGRLAGAAEQPAGQRVPRDRVPRATTWPSWRRSPTVLGKTADAIKYRDLADKRKAFFNATFVNADKKTLATGGSGFGGAHRAGCRARIPPRRHPDVVRRRTRTRRVQPRERAAPRSRTSPTTVDAREHRRRRGDAAGALADDRVHRDGVDQQGAVAERPVRAGVPAAAERPLSRRGSTPSTRARRRSGNA